jgi:hypothetical protein
VRLSIFNPWRRIRELEAQARADREELRTLEHALHQSNDRYDRIRDANHQLRGTLALYREASR